jgi:hypothetical protein
VAVARPAPIAGAGTVELTTGGGHGAPTPHPESLLVLYLGDEDGFRVTLVPERWSGGTTVTTEVAGADPPRRR